MKFGPAALAAVMLALAGCASSDTGATAATSSASLVPVTAEGYMSAKGLPYREGPRGLLDVYRPLGPGPFPVLFFIYGGAWVSGDRTEFEYVGAAFARRGFVTVIADYTLYPQGTYPVFLQDNAAALAWTMKNIGPYGGDTEHLAVMGHSAGAYNASMLSYDRRWLEGAGVAPDVVDAFAGLSGPYDFYPYTMKIEEAVFGGIQSDSIEPFTHLDGGNPPALLIHGADDPTIAPHQSQVMAAKLAEAGLPVDLHILPGQTHTGVMLGLASAPDGDPAVVGPIMTFLTRTIGAGASGRP